MIRAFFNIMLLHSNCIWKTLACQLYATKKWGGGVGVVL